MDNHPPLIKNRFRPVWPARKSIKNWCCIPVHTCYYIRVTHIQWIERNLGLIEGIVRRSVRSFQFCNDEVEDIFSGVLIKLLNSEIDINHPKSYIRSISRHDAVDYIDKKDKERKISLLTYAEYIPKEFGQIEIEDWLMSVFSVDEIEFIKKRINHEEIELHKSNIFRLRQKMKGKYAINR